jgi:pimeloyl-ACP methyl ester carboxylesterase
MRARSATLAIRAGAAAAGLAVGERIEIFARELAAADRASARLPWLLFLQGGPGFGAPRPHGRGGWLGRALDDYRVLLLDQRGTGRSTPATRQTLARFGTAAEQARFTGEMIYPWMFDADPVLRPLRGAADALAERTDWPVLYDPARLAANDVPVVAAVCEGDMYVPAEFSVPTARAIRGLNVWVTSECEHDGLRVSNGAVLDRVIALARGTA